MIRGIEVAHQIGAAISMAIVNQHSAICGVVAISPPFEMLGEIFQDTAITKPKFFIIGNQKILLRKKPS